MLHHVARRSGERLTNVETLLMRETLPLGDKHPSVCKETQAEGAVSPVWLDAEVQGKEAKRGYAPV